MLDLISARHFLIHTQHPRDEVQTILAAAIQPRTSLLRQLARGAVDRPDYAGIVAGNHFRMSRRARYAVMAPTVRGAILDDLGGARVEADVLLLATPQL